MSVFVSLKMTRTRLDARLRDDRCRDSSSGLFEQSRLLFLPCYSVRRRSIRFVIRLVPRAVVVDRIESCIRSRYFFFDGEPCLEDDADFFFASAAIVASGGPSCAPCNSLTMSFISSLSKKLRLS